MYLIILKKCEGFLIWHTLTAYHNLIELVFHSCEQDRGSETWRAAGPKQVPFLVFVISIADINLYVVPELVSNFPQHFAFGMLKGKLCPGLITLYHSREHFDNTDDSLMLSSITSMMHQFYIKHRNYWWRFDVTSLCHPWFDCLSTFMPTLFRRININDSSGC